MAHRAGVGDLFRSLPLRGRIAVSDRAIGKLCDKLRHDDLGIELYRSSKRSYVPPTEHAARHVRNLVALEPLKDGKRDLRGIRDLSQ